MPAAVLRPANGSLKDSASCELCRSVQTFGRGFASKQPPGPRSCLLGRSAANASRRCVARQRPECLASQCKRRKAMQGWGFELIVSTAAHVAARRRGSCRLPPPLGIVPNMPNTRETVVWQEVLPEECCAAVQVWPPLAPGPWPLPGVDVHLLHMLIEFRSPARGMQGLQPLPRCRRRCCSMQPPSFCLDASPRRMRQLWQSAPTTGCRGT